MRCFVEPLWIFVIFVFQKTGMAACIAVTSSAAGTSTEPRARDPQRLKLDPEVPSSPEPPEGCYDYG